MKTTCQSENAPLWSQDARWRAFHVGLGSRHHPKIEMLLKAAEWLCKAYLSGDRSKGSSLVVAGNTGCGKTHMAKRVWEYVRARQVSAFLDGKLGGGNHIGDPAFVRWERVAEMDDRDWTEVVRGDVKPARFVILDDIGADTDQFKSGVPARRLKEVLDAAEGKWLLVTTNVGKPDWKDRFGQRVADRLAPARYLGLFEVPSYRQLSTP